MVLQPDRFMRYLINLIRLKTTPLSVYMTDNKDKYIHKQIWVGLVFAFIAEGITILLLAIDSNGPSGPWVILNLIPFIIGNILSGQMMCGGIGIFFHIASVIQWFIIGYIISKLYFRYLYENV